MNTLNEEPKRQQRLGKHWARRTHRVLGVSSVTFIFLISLTGLVLSHADTLKLSTHYISGPVMLGLYGIDAPPVETAFEARGVIFATADNKLFANGQLMADEVEALRGAITKDDVIVLATDSEFFIVTQSAELVERFAPDVSGLTGRLGTDGQLVVADIDSHQFVFDTNSMRLQSLPGITNVTWSQAVTPSQQQVANIAATSLGKTLSWERVLSDLHSGRILPTVGRYLADITAICLLYLCVTGIFLWFRRR